MNLRVRQTPAMSAGQARIRFVHTLRGGKAQGPRCIGVSLLPDGAPARDDAAWAELRAGTAFLIDSALEVMPAEELAAMIGCFFFASVAGRGHGRVEVAVGDGQGMSAAARVMRPDFTIEANDFGAAHVLYENDTLGLYVLEVAPGATIPAHYHRVMQESELVLDAGLLQQNLPVRPGDAFTWPTGYVHAYRNPTKRPKRILCIDRPKFIPEDEVVVTGAPLLIPVKPEWNYLR